MYVTWKAVLLGAVVAANLPTWRVDERLAHLSSGGVRLGFSLALIAALWRAQRRGKTCRIAALAPDLGVADLGHRRASADPGAAPALPPPPRTAPGCWPGTPRPRPCTTFIWRWACRSPARWLARPLVPWQMQVAPAMDRIVKAEAAAMRT